ncbi:ribonuclease P protein component, partial [Haemophilus parainfluenzae]|uniref:ribonuclease P protein component n=1 Tax=Haemophilus parainfluenzae TaxID=729 RepID=UPI00124B4C43
VLSVNPGRLSRIGVSVSNKVSKRAVVRNRIKRRVKAVVKQLLPAFRGRYDIVISARSTAVECDYGEILRELEQLLNQLEVIDGYS